MEGHVFYCPLVSAVYTLASSRLEDLILAATPKINPGRRQKGGLRVILSFRPSEQLAVWSFGRTLATMSAAERMAVRLTGGGPWGFRLQGGSGTGQPLTVAKIRRKSRSHKNLFENDVIISINEQACAGLSYDEAMNIVDGAGSTLLIKINRPAKGKENVAPQTTDSGKTSPIVFRNESEHAKILNDGHTTETATRRSENIYKQTKQQSSYQHSETSPQPSKPFPDHLETSPQPIVTSRTPSPPCNHELSPQISPPLPRQPDPSLHKPISPYSKPIEQQTTQTHTEMYQQQERRHYETVQRSSHHSEQPQSQIQPLYETVQQKEIYSERPQFESVQQQTQFRAQPSQSEIQRQYETVQKREIHSQHALDDKSYIKTLQSYEQKTTSGYPGSVVSATQTFSRQYVSSEPPQSNQPEQLLPESQQTSQTTSQSLVRSSEPVSTTSQSSMFQQHVKEFKTETPWTSESVGHTWRPMGSAVTQEITRTEMRETQQEVKKKVPPPTLPKPKQRPISAPPMDVDIFKAFQSETPLVGMDARPTDAMKVKGFPASIFLPPEDEEMDISLFTRRRKMYSSSSFYEEPGSIYPTLEEQVELCRKIADSLSADTNKKSRGANMFFKRVKRSHKWIHEGPDRAGSDGFTSDSDYDSSSTPDPSKMEYIRVSKGPPKLKLIMAPRPVQDMVKLRTMGERFNEHTAVSPDICYNLVRDLNSPCGKGAAMYAKRKQKAEDWVVDEEKVKAQVAKIAAEYPPPSKTPEFPWSARLRLVKSPWDAALASPIGSCDAAFYEIPPGDRIDAFASSLIRAAENKVRNNPNGPPPPLLATLANDLCMPIAPKGWMGTTTTESFPSLDTSMTSDTSYYDSVAARLEYEPTVAPRNLTFRDFNTRPQSWSPAGFSSMGFRSVRPPTH